MYCSTKKTMHCFIYMKCLISLLQVVTDDEIYRPLESFLVSTQLKVEIKCQEEGDELVLKILMALMACGVSGEQISIMGDYNPADSKLFVYSLPFLCFGILLYILFCEIDVNNILLISAKLLNSEIFCKFDMNTD